MSSIAGMVMVGGTHGVFQDSQIRFSPMRLNESVDESTRPSRVRIMITKRMAIGT